MKLDLRFTNRPLDELWCDTVIAFVFQGGAVQNRNGIAGLDAKTSGTLTALAQKGFWTGEEGETLLVPSKDMIKADKILLKGFGSYTRYTRDLLSERVREIGTTLERMAVSDVGIRIPVNEGAESEYRLYVETACVHLVDTFLSGHKDKEDFLLKLVVSFEEAFVADIEQAVRQLKKHFKSKLDYTIIFDRVVTTDN